MQRRSSEYPLVRRCLCRLWGSGQLTEITSEIRPSTIDALEEKVSQGNYGKASQTLSREAADSRERLRVWCRNFRCRNRPPHTHCGT
jgi:hypothetical protein